MQRAVRNQPDSQGAQRGNHFQFDGPHRKVVQALLRGQAQEILAVAADWAKAMSQAAKLLLPT